MGQTFCQAAEEGDTGANGSAPARPGEKGSWPPTVGKPGLAGRAAFAWRDPDPRGDLQGLGELCFTAVRLPARGGAQGLAR